MKKKKFQTYISRDWKRFQLYGNEQNSNSINCSCECEVSFSIRYLLHPLIITDFFISKYSSFKTPCSNIYHKPSVNSYLHGKTGTTVSHLLRKSYNSYLYKSLLTLQIFDTQITEAQYTSGFHRTNLIMVKACQVKEHGEQPSKIYKKKHRNWI